MSSTLRLELPHLDDAVADGELTVARVALARLLGEVRAAYSASGDLAGGTPDEGVVLVTLSDPESGPAAMKAAAWALDLRYRLAFEGFVRRADRAHGELAASLPDAGELREKIAGLLRDAGLDVPDAGAGYGDFAAAVASHPLMKAHAARVADLRALREIGPTLRANRDAIEAVGARLAAARRVEEAERARSEPIRREVMAMMADAQPIEA